MNWHERFVRGSTFLGIATFGSLLQAGSFWLPEWTRLLVWWIGTVLTWTAVVMMVYSLYHVVGPGVRLSTWRRMSQLGWRWKSYGFHSPCGKREIRRVESGVWAGVNWAPGHSGFYRGIECPDPLAAFLAAHLDNWGE